MKFRVRSLSCSSLFFAAVLSVISATSASAVVLVDTGIQTLLSTDPTTLGRISRNGVPSDWSASKAFPGDINATTSYHYQLVTIHVMNTPFIQVSIDEPGVVFFAAAYLDSFVPGSFSTNYLGDAGATGNIFGNPAFFQIVVPAGHDLVLFVEDTIPANGGVGHSYRLLVEGFIDTEFTDPPAGVPGPIIGAGLPGLVMALSGLLALRRRRMAA